MPSNTTLNAGSGGDVITTKERTHDGDATKQQGVFISGVTGSEGSYTFTDVTAGGGTESTALRVTIASDSTGVLSVDDNGSTLSIDDGGGAITVDGTVAVSGTVTVDSELPAAAALADNTATPTAPAVGAFAMVYDGATWDMARGTAADGVLVNLGANNDVTVTGTVTANLAAGTNNIGDVDVLTVPSDPFGANADAASATGSISAKLRFIASTGIPITGTVTVGSHAVTNAGTFAVQAGQAAHDAAISGNPVRLAGRALTSSYTAVATGDTADLITTTIGQLVEIPYSIPENTWSYAAASGGITNTTGVTAKASAGAGLRNYITRVQVINGHATVSTDVQIRDGASGTVLWRGFAQAAGGGVSAVFDPPLRGTAATLVEVACGTTGSATYFNLQGYVAP